MAAEQFILQTINPEVNGNVAIACLNLSEMVGDNKGKINRSTAEVVLKGLQVTSVGTISIDLTEQVTSSPKWSSRIELEQFLGELSSRGTDIFYALRNNDENYVAELTENVADLAIISPLILESKTLKPYLRNAIGAIYIELYALYLELLALQPNTTISGMNRTDLMVLNNNIRWLSNQLEALDTPPFELIQVLRYAQRTILYIRSMSSLFVDTYAVMTQDLGVIDSE